MNQFAQQCESIQKHKRRIHAIVDENNSSFTEDDSKVNIILHRDRINAIEKDEHKIEVLINDTLVDMAIDTGAMVNILDSKGYAKLNPKPKLEELNNRRS